MVQADRNRLVGMTVSYIGQTMACSVSRIIQMIKFINHNKPLLNLRRGDKGQITLTLGVLRSAAGLVLAVLLALDLSGVAGEEASGLELDPQVAVVAD